MSNQTLSSPLGTNCSSYQRQLASLSALASWANSCEHVEALAKLLFIFQPNRFAVSSNASRATLTRPSFWTRAASYNILERAGVATLLFGLADLLSITFLNCTHSIWARGTGISGFQTRREVPSNKPSKRPNKTPYNSISSHAANFVCSFEMERVADFFKLQNWSPRHCLALYWIDLKLS